MLDTSRILVTGLAIVIGTACLIGCGQKGSLYLPTDPLASQRASLPATLVPALPVPASSATSPGTAP